MNWERGVIQMGRSSVLIGGLGAEDTPLATPLATPPLASPFLRLVLV